jgi:cytochrome b561
MMWRNTRRGYGLVSIGLHWLVAVVVVGQFAVGLWMTDLNYYHAWYQRAPDIHKGVGVLLLGVMLARLAWHCSSPPPAAIGAASERRMAVWVHRTLYLLIFAVLVSGYLISTADGRAIDVFGLFRLPAILSGPDNQEDVAGRVHASLAFVLIALTLAHALAALKHHFWDHDETLKRMLYVKR